MSNKRIIDLTSGSVSDNGLSFIGDPINGQLTQTSFKQLKDYLIAGVSGSGGNINTSSLVTQTQFASFTGSNNTSIANIYASESNYLTTASFNSFSAANTVAINNVFASQSVYATVTSLQTLSGSYSTDSSSFNIRINNATGSGGTVNTGSLLSTASFNTFTSSYSADSASFNTRISSISGSAAVYSGSLNLQQVTTAGSSSNNPVYVPDLFFNSGSITSSFSLVKAMSNYFQGDDSVILATAIVSPTVSGSGATWKYLTSANHSTIYFTEITASNSNLTLTFPQVSSVVSFGCFTDDSLGPYGVQFSVVGNQTNLIVSLWAPTNQEITLTTASSATWSVSDSFGSGTQVTYNTGSGVHSVVNMSIPDNLARGLLVPQYVGTNPYFAKLEYNGASINQIDFKLINYQNGFPVTGSVLNANDRIHIGNMHTLYRSLSLTGFATGSYENKIFTNGLANFQVIAVLRK